MLANNPRIADELGKTLSSNGDDENDRNEKW
jgi:hypothetical protein